MLKKNDVTVNRDITKKRCLQKTNVMKNQCHKQNEFTKKHNVIPPQIRIKWNLNLIIPIGFSTILKSKTIEKPMVFQHFDHAHTRKKKTKCIIPHGFATIFKSKTIEKPMVFQHVGHAHTRKKKNTRTHARKKHTEAMSDFDQNGSGSKTYVFPKENGPLALMAISQLTHKTTPIWRRPNMR